MKSFQTRVVTKDLKIVKVEPVCYDNDGFSVILVDEQGILHYKASYISDLLKVNFDIISTCNDDKISDEEFLESVKDLISEFSS